MTANPVLAYAGPESISQDISIVRFDGNQETVRGTVRDAETMPGEAAQVWADAGPLAWIAYDGDPDQIEFVEYVDATGSRLHRRKIKGQRVGSIWNTCKLNLSSESATVASGGMFSSRDFSSLDYDTG